MSTTTTELWSFGAALSFLSGTLLVTSNGVPTTNPPLKTIKHDASHDPLATLGNFESVLSFLNPTSTTTPTSKAIPIKAHRRHASSTSSIAGSFNSTAGSTFEAETEAVHFDEFVKTKEVKWKDEKGTQAAQDKSDHKKKARDERDWKEYNISKLQELINSKAALPGEEPSIVSQQKKSRSETGNGRKSGQLSDFESEGEVLPGRRLSRDEKAKSAVGAGSASEKNGNPLTLTPSASLLTPAWVKPPPKADIPDTSTADKPVLELERQIISPLLSLTKEEKKARIIRRLLKHFNDFGNSSSATSLARIGTQVGGNVFKHGIHVFVDASNIVIGFQNELKKARNIHQFAYVKRPPISYHSLALVMERGRGAARRVLCGSVDRSSIQPDYMLEARECGYEISALERVEKVRIPTPKKRRGGSGYATSGQSSGSDAPTSVAKTMGEQAVDELLQMKMLESMIDYPASTMVLATGDAAEAEYSGGFLANVERALERGWKVELVTWRDGMSFAWKNRTFLNKWKSRFLVVELDAYCEDLLAEYAVPEFGTLKSCI